jgi:uncharacterized membrane protein
MAVMALDHVRHYWGPTTFRPEDLTQASALLFFTRWVTHFCAPAFLFLSGVSVFLYGQRQGSRPAVSLFLLTRGLWLIALEVIVINLLMQFAFNLILLEVIWVIGCRWWCWRPWCGCPDRPLPFWRLSSLRASTCCPSRSPSRRPTWAGQWSTARPFSSRWRVCRRCWWRTRPLPGLGVMLAGYAVGPWFTLPPGPASGSVGGRPAASW